MRNISTLTMLRGQVVHTVISRALRSIRLGLDVDIETAKQSVTEVIRERYMESKRKLWHYDNRPRDRKQSSITNILEHYYDFPDVDNRALEARAIAWQCVENLMGSALWQEIATSDPKLWMEIDEDDFPNFEIDGIKIYSIIDFAHVCGAPTIIDWKTGTPGEQDRQQLILYSLYAQSKWEWEPEQTNLTAVYLHPVLNIDTFTPTSDQIDAVKEEARQSFSQMMEVEPAFGPADPANFPPTDNKQFCPWCRFRGMCEI